MAKGKHHVEKYTLIRGKQEYLEKKTGGGVLGEGISRVKRPEWSLGRKRATLA